MKTIYSILLFFLLSTRLYSTIINVPADQLTIQAGINTSVNLDTVLVQPGTYVENINYNGKNITVGSLFLTTQDTTLITQTIIDGNAAGSVVTFTSGEDSTSVLIGFTIINGLGGGAFPNCYAGGITCSNSSNPNLENLTITDNYAYCGGGIFCNNSDPKLQNVTISDNIVDMCGGGIYCYNSNPSLQNTTISENSSTSQGGGIVCASSNMNLMNVTISGNTALFGGGINIMNGSTLSLINCILWNDSTQEIYCYQGNDPNSITISYSDIQGGEAGIVTNNNCTINWLDGSINEDPLFVDPLDGDYRLTENSPCIDAGDPASPLDPDGTIADMGAYHFNQYNGPVWHISTTGSDLTGNGSELYPFATIQNGIGFSNDADTVLVQPGTYFENINYSGKLITVASLFLTTQDTTYISQTVIDGDSLDSVVKFETGEDSTAVLSGFTITNGLGGGEYPVWFAGGITCDNSSKPNLENLIITSNYALHGGGISCRSSSNPRIIHTKVINNSAGNGGGIGCYNSNPSFSNVIISGNSVTGGGGGIRSYISNPSFENVVISSNFAHIGAGISLSNSSPSLLNVIIVSNNADYGSNTTGGGIHCFWNSNPILLNVTMSANSADIGGGIYLDDSDPSFMNSILWNDSPEEIYILTGSVTAIYSDVQGGWTGIGNIDTDPLFVDPVAGVYHLTGNSPCIDAGNPSYPLDPDNTICDMGAYYYHQDQYIIVEEIYPEPDSLTISEGDSINFYIYAIDPDGNTIEYCWELDDEVVSNDSCYTFYTDENSAGEYQVALNITDNYQPTARNELNFEWELIVEDGVTTQELLPSVTAIYQNYPNPFNPITTINYSLKKESKVSLTIYNIKGQKVKQLVNDQLPTGQYVAGWNGKDDNNKSVSSGIYFYKLKAEGYVKTKRMILLK